MVLLEKLLRMWKMWYFDKKQCKKCDNNGKIQLDKYTKTLKRLSRIKRGNTLWVIKIDVNGAI